MTWKRLTGFRSRVEASERKVQLDLRAAVLRREAGDRPAVSLHDLGADEETETGPGNRADGVCAESPLEDMRTLLRGDADSVIADRDARLGRRRPYLDVDGSAVRRVFDRVPDQILKDTLHTPFVVVGENRAGRG